MNEIKIASPLFIVREDAAKDLFGTMDKIAQAGFDGIELLGMFGKTAREIKRHADALGIAVIGDHVPLNDLLADGQVIDDRREMGCPYITVSWPSNEIGPAHAEFESVLADINRASQKIIAAGMTPLFHNHAAEIADPYWIARLLAACAPHGLRFEPDLGWMFIAGANPADYLRDYADISPALHFKDACPSADANGVNGFTFRPTGYGAVNYPALMPLALACKPEWIVADHDCAYTRDSYEELALSLRYIRNLLRIHTGA